MEKDRASGMVRRRRVLLSNEAPLTTVRTVFGSLFEHSCSTVQTAAGPEFTTIQLGRSEVIG